MCCNQEQLPERRIPKESYKAQRWHAERLLFICKNSVSLGYSDIGVVSKEDKLPFPKQL
jgi:hypothetical protein